MNRLAAIFALAALATGAPLTPSAAAAPLPQQACRPATPEQLEAQRREVRRAAAPVEAAQSGRLAVLEQAPDTPETEAALDALVVGYHRQAAAVLEPLAAAGNAEAMMRLALEVRESHAREDVARWLGLVACASAVGHPGADDELVRWYWHQRGDGSIAEVQRSRALALDHAARAADAGAMQALARLAVYISGDLHQFPASPALGGRLMALCARTGDPQCQENLMGLGAYDWGETPAGRYLWISRGAARQPALYAARRDAAWTALAPDDRIAARRLEADWRPAAWAELRPAWEQLRADILRHGETSAGDLPNCSTSTPWCRAP